MASGEEVAEKCSKLGSGTAVAMCVDMADMDSIKKFVEHFEKKFSVLDVLVNNAGIMNCPEGKTKDGFELQFGTNHLGHFYLTHLLLPSLKKAHAPRCITLSSCFHKNAMGKRGFIDFEDPNFETRKYEGWTAYAQSKLANLLFSKEMAKRHPDILCASVHPGFVDSNLMKMNAAAYALSYPILTYGYGRIDAWSGVQTSLHAILSDDIESGKYYAQCGSPAGSIGGWPCDPKDINDEVTEENAAKLWDLSLKLLKLQ